MPGSAKIFFDQNSIKFAEQFSIDFARYQATLVGNVEIDNSEFSRFK
jgi:hypothetical protein